jgi:Sec-independent protein translocase protein TatA
MSFSHIIILGIILIIFIPPEKLPDVMRNIARFINDLRRNTTGVWEDIKRDAAVRPEDIYNSHIPTPPPPLPIPEAAPVVATEQTAQEESSIQTKTNSGESNE